MKNKVLILSFLIFCAMLTACTSTTGTSTAQSSILNSESAKKLETNLSGSEWLYTWRGREYEFKFNDNGSIGALESWNDVTWFVSGENNAVLDAGPVQMLLNFNSDLSTFQTIDWDGEKASGKRAVQ